MSPQARQRVRAVVVTFNPELERLSLVLRSLLPQVAGIVIVDNGSLNATEVKDLVQGFDDVEFLGLDENRGIASALNLGVDRTLLMEPDWILTMDQDTIVHPGGVDDVLTSFSEIASAERERVGILAMRSQPQSSSIWITRYADRLLVVGEGDKFIERRGVITSGNLVRADVFSRTRFNESLFIDQVDFDFCYALRQQGLKVLLSQRVSMDHILGEQVNDTGKDHPYENAQRMYYIVRNSTYLALRRRLSVRFYLVQVIVFCGAYVSVNGARSVGYCAFVVARGVFDGVFVRLGQREYPLLAKDRA